MSSPAYTRTERHTICYHLPTPLASDALARAVADAEQEYRQTWGSGPLPDEWFYLVVEQGQLALKFRVDQPGTGPRMLDLAATQLLPRTGTR